MCDEPLEVLQLPLVEDYYQGASSTHRFSHLTCGRGVLMRTCFLAEMVVQKSPVPVLFMLSGDRS